MKKFYDMIETPAMLIDEKITLNNIKMMQELSNRKGVALRPHIKTHRMTYFAKLQMEAGASGIACAKIGEAEVMAKAGIEDIFIANEIVGISKYERLKMLNRKIKTLRIGVDNTFQIDQIEKVFNGEKPLEVLIEYEVGEVRSGIISDEDLLFLAKYVNSKKNVVLKGIFSHEGHTYKASSMEICKEKAEEAYRRTVRAAELIRDEGIPLEIVSVGATPSIMNGAYFEGITEFRLGTYIFFDLGQALAINDFSKCSASVLASVISKPTDSRVVIDAGAKALVSQNRTEGICATNGFGYVKDSNNVRLKGLFDEHGIIENKKFSQEISIGDKIEVIPSHICPTVNLYDKVYLINDGYIVKEIPVDCRGKSQ
ncbi:alanine racemase [Veillonella criceti]|uniref:D-threonine aldolase n=1 Tax=Veillonella criceti TaxID=103891 RepID=A0A380NFQ1_9FIRM|nr:alanine racemase [Veillonella criceti]SUP39484.1 D-threonine aldolase [Veillonella criceti]